MDVDSTDAVMWLTEQGLPVYTTVVPNAGLTAPMTLMGCLVVGNAEFLAITAFQQMVREGTPVIYASLPTVADMRTGAYAPGAIETGILLAAQAQLARFYDVPAGGYIGLTNAHSNDAQSGYETGMNTLLGVSAGATLLNMGGLFSSLMAFDFAKAVVDNEIALMNKRVVARPRVQRGEPGARRDRRGRARAAATWAASTPRRACGPRPCCPSSPPATCAPSGKRPAGQTSTSRALAEARRILPQPNPAVWDERPGRGHQRPLRRPRRRRRDTLGGVEA